MKNKKSICLNMIVRNESPVIRRCLKSVKPLIDSWVIVDTGSTDGTQAIIREELKEIPGELFERPWVNFSHNRTEAVQLAKGKGDYVLLIDADEEIEIEDGFEMPELTNPLYLVDVNLGLLAAHREIFLNNHLEWYWEGVLHEQVYCKTPLTRFGTIKGLKNRSHPDGNRSLDPNKFFKELEVLKKGLEAEPENARYMFYLAQTYAACGKYQEALAAYQKRVEMGGWNQEVYQSLYRIGFLQEILNESPRKIIDSYLQAHGCLKVRAEPLFRIAYQLYCCGECQEALRIARSAADMPFPNAHNAFYIEPYIYESWIAKLIGDCYFQLGDQKEALCWYQKIVDCSSLSEEGREQVQSSIKIIKEKPESICNSKIPRRLYF